MCPAAPGGTGESGMNPTASSPVWRTIRLRSSSISVAVAVIAMPGVAYSRHSASARMAAIDSSRSRGAGCPSALAASGSRQENAMRWRSLAVARRGGRTSGAGAVWRDTAGASDGRRAACRNRIARPPGEISRCPPPAPASRYISGHSDLRPCGHLICRLPNPECAKSPSPPPAICRGFADSGAVPTDCRPAPNLVNTPPPPRKTRGFCRAVRASHHVGRLDGTKCAPRSVNPPADPPGAPNALLA